MTRDPALGVAKSVCHRDRRSLTNRQLRRPCRTEFGSPIRGSPGVAKCYDLLRKSGSVVPLYAIFVETLYLPTKFERGADIYVDKYQPPNKKEIS